MSVSLNTLKFIIIIVNSILYEQAVNQTTTVALEIVINILVCLYFVMSFIDFFTVYPISSIQKSSHYITAMASCGCASFIAPFYLSFNLISSKQLTCICLLVLPLVSFGFSTLWSSILKFLLFEVFQNENHFSSKDMKYLEKKISLFYNNKQFLIRTQYLKVIG